MQFTSVKKVLTVALSLSLIAFSQPVLAKKVGISLPNPDIPRFNLDGEVMAGEIEDNGHEALIRTGDRTPERQIKDIENLIQSGCEYLIIVPVDGNALTDVLKKAKDKKIPVIAYDRLIMDSDAVRYYATFDNYK